MNKNIFILAIVSLLTFQSFSQAFYQLEGDHLSIFKITVSSPAANKISVKFPLQSSRRCACEENEVIELIRGNND